jgi:hypothetical protein
MKALLINSTQKTITEIDLDKGLDPIYKAIGNGCNCFACPVVFDNGDTLYVDDEGLFKQQEGAFMFPNWAYPIVGNAVIVGCDDEGESVDAKSTPQDFSDIMWLNQAQVENYQSNFL